MTIEVEAPDGAIVEFPGDTPPETIKRVMMRQTQKTQKAPEPPTAYEQYGAPVVKAIGEAGTAVANYVAPKQDPRFKGVRTLYEQGALPVDTYNWALLTAPNDKGLTQMVRGWLGKNLLREDVDSNGHTVFTVRHPTTGKIIRGYVNIPGLDSSDWDRAIGGAVPYMLGAYATGGLTRGASLLRRSLAQAGTAGTVSLGQDFAGQAYGSREPIDFGKAVTMAGFGAGGEVLGHVVANFARKYMKSRVLVGPDGKLTPRGRRVAERNNLDPDLVDKEIGEEIARRSAAAGDPDEVIRHVVTDRYGIPTTKGQRTNDPQQILTEKDVRVGTFGPAAKKRLEEIDRLQRERVKDVVQARIGGQIAPHRSFVNETPSSLGEGIKGGFDTAARNAKLYEKNAWAKVGNLEASVAAKQQLPAHIRRSLGTMRIVPQNQPSAAAMVGELRAFQAGKAPGTDVSEFLGQQSVTYVDEMRRTLLAHVRNASTQGGDKAVAGRIYRGFLDWVQDAGARKLLTGDMNAAKALRQAIDATRTAREVMDATLAAGTKRTPATAILARLKTAQSGEDVVNTLLGRGAPTSKPSNGAFEGLRAYKAALDRFGGDAAKPAWDDVRLAYWARLVSNGQGEVLSPRMIIKNIETARRQQKSIMKLLFQGREVREMMTFANALRAINPTDPNPSGSGTAVRNLFPQLAKEAAYTQSKRETFSKHNILSARLWRFLGSTIKTFEKPVGRTVANKATSQTLTRKPAPGLAAFTVGPVGATTPSENTPAVGRFAINALRAMASR